MKKAAIAKRVEKLEARLLPGAGNGATLEEACRAAWNRDPEGFRELAAGNMLGYFVHAFETTEARRDSAHARHP